MFSRVASRFRCNVQSFNITPIIDIALLLIIFFLMVCQFIEAENFPVSVPDGCRFAAVSPDVKGQVTTVTVMKTTQEQIDFAVGSDKITASSYPALVGKLAELIDVRLNDLPLDRRIVTLRIDKDVRYADAQYALAAVAQSSATDVRLAALKYKRADSQ